MPGGGRFFLPPNLIIFDMIPRNWYDGSILGKILGAGNTEG